MDLHVWTLLKGAAARKVSLRDVITVCQILSAGGGTALTFTVPPAGQRLSFVTHVLYSGTASQRLHV